MLAGLDHFPDLQKFDAGNYTNDYQQAEKNKDDAFCHIKLNYHRLKGWMFHEPPNVVPGIFPSCGSSEKNYTASIRTNKSTQLMAGISRHDKW